MVIHPFTRNQSKCFPPRRPGISIRNAKVLYRPLIVSYIKICNQLDQRHHSIAAARRPPRASEGWDSNPQLSNQQKAQTQSVLRKPPIWRGFTRRQYSRRMTHPHPNGHASPVTSLVSLSR